MNTATAEARIRELVDEALPAELPRIAGLLAQAQAEVMARIVAGHPGPADASAAALSVDEAAERLGVSADWLYKAARRGCLPFVARVGRRLTCDPQKLERWRQGRMGRAA
jgi:excisionase family DNA binding protein